MDKHITIVAVLLVCVMFQPFNTYGKEQIQLQLRWDHQFQFAGYYTADWKGFYAEEGLSVLIRSALTGDGKILSATQEVAEGRADFGIGAADILLAYDRGVDLRVVASILQQSAAAFYVKAETSFTSLADFTTLRVARRVNDLIDIELQAMLLSEGIDLEQVEPYPHQPGLEHLLNDSVQVIPGYQITMPFYAETLGIPVREIRPATYGIDFYGDTLFTTEEMIDRHPDIVQRFVRASLKGWKYALDHQEEIVEDIAEKLVRTYPLDNPQAFNLFQAHKIQDLTLYSVVDLGHINPHRFEKMYELLRATGRVTRPFDPKTFIYDPARIEAERRYKIIRGVVIAASVLGLLLVFAVIALFIFRKMIAIKTTANERLSREVIKRKRMEDEIRTLNVDLEKRVQQRTAELELVNQELQHFMYAASHDLKTPLRGISQIASWLEEDYHDDIDARRKKMFTLLRDRVKRMYDLLDGILEYSNIGHLLEKRTVIPLQPLVLIVLQELSPPESIHIAIEGTLPVVAGEERCIKKVFHHLLRNAIHAIDDTRGEITIRSADEGTHWKVSIADNGPGIDEKYHEKIFQFFQTLDSRPLQRRLGIGLAVAQKIIQLHGGDIRVESTPGQGSTFSFTLAK